MQRSVKNSTFIALIVLSNTVGNLFLGLGMQRMPGFSHVSFAEYLVSLGTNLWIIFGVALLIVWMVSQLSMFTWADLTYVLPVTASAYVLTAIFSEIFLHERISAERWIGVVLISLGVMFVSRTPPRAKEILQEGAR